MSVIFKFCYKFGSSHIESLYRSSSSIYLEQIKLKERKYECVSFWLTTSFFVSNVNDFYLSKCDIFTPITKLHDKHLPSFISWKKLKGTEAVMVKVQKY